LGQARNRGSQQDRIAEALARSTAVPATPPVISCNHCQAVLQAPEQMNVRALKGIQLAYQAHCSACDQDTWAVKGEPAAVRAFYDALEKAAGQKVQLGTTKPALNG
jgi:RNase P subunit RPR2